VTICTKEREEFFGKIMNKKMILNEIGRICEEEIKNLRNRKTVDVHEYIVMPNHVHILLAMDERLSSEPRRDGLNRPNAP
jgi:REP element-mobilizing transposase RayT